MFSNLPTMLQQQDFQASNRDMLEAAMRSVPLTKSEIDVARKYAAISMRMIPEYNPMSDAIEIKSPCMDWPEAHAKIGSILRIRIPKDFAIIDRTPFRITDEDERAEVSFWRSCSVSPIPPPSSRD